MNRIRSLAPAALVAVLAASAQAEPARAPAALEARPELALGGCSVEAVEADGTTLGFVARLSNPTSDELELAGVSYALDVDGKRVFDGTFPGGSRVAPGGTLALPLPGRVRYADVPGLAAKVALKDRVVYRLAGSAAVRTARGEAVLPLAHEGALSVPKLPAVGLAGFRIESANPFDAAVEVKVGLENENPFPLPAGLLRYRITIAGSDVASAEAALPPLPAGGKAVLPLPVKISLRNAGKGVVRAIRSDAAEVGVHGLVSLGGLSVPVDLVARLPTR